MKRHTITISIDANGNFTYAPAVLHAGHNDKVSWLCDDGSFAVSFEQTPFETSQIHGHQGVATTPRKFRRGVEPGTYHYQVAVALVEPSGKKGHPDIVKVFLNAGCPEIIIDT